MDVHGPFEHRRRYDCMLSALVGNGLDSLVIIGDFLDMYNVHQHGSHHPGVGKSLQEEIEWGIKKLDEIDRLFPNIPKLFVEGNHEFRFERYLVEKMPGLFGVTELRGLLKMHERPNWRWSSFGPSQLEALGDSGLYLKHDPGPGSLIALPKNLGHSLCHGHTHRRTEASHRTLTGKVNRVFSGGWLGDERHDKVFGYVKGHFLWEGGFTYVEWEKDYFEHHNVQFDPNHGCVLNGRRYR